jgi:hypothetical protein
MRRRIRAAGLFLRATAAAWLRLGGMLGKDDGHRPALSAS